MNIITISREFGSGGRELGKRLAEQLGYDYYDREIITAIANQKGLDEFYVERALESNTWQMAPLTYRRSFTGAGMAWPSQANLLVEEKHVIEGIAKKGKDCVIVGRNADVILRNRNPFRMFVCAGMDAKIRRCMERVEKGENLSPREIENNIRRIDRGRARTRELVGGGRWGESGSFHLTVNTTDWEIKELVPAVAEFALCWLRSARKNAPVPEGNVSQ